MSRGEAVTPAQVRSACFKDELDLRARMSVSRGFTWRWTSKWSWEWKGMVKVEVRMVVVF